MSEEHHMTHLIVRTPGEKKAYLSGMKVILDLLVQGRDIQFVKQAIKIYELTLRPEESESYG